MMESRRIHRTDGSYEPPITVQGDGDIRIYGDEGPWWGFGRVTGITVGQARVLLERLTCFGLTLEGAYLSTVRDVLCTDLRIGGDTPPDEWASALTLDGLHVHGHNNGGSVVIHNAANIVWTGGSIERCMGPLVIGSGDNEGTIILVGTRIEHDHIPTLRIKGKSPVLMVGCHFTATDVEFAPDAHPESKLIGCSHTVSQVRDLRPRRPWWRVWR